MLKTSKVVQDLVKAMDCIDAPEKWCKVDLKYEVDGRRTQYCMLGAVAMALYGHTMLNPLCTLDRHTMATLDRVRDAIAKHFPDRVGDIFKTTIPHFNDHPATTHDDVMLIMRAAITNAD